MTGSLSRSIPLLSIRDVEGEERTVELSFSSEEPYARWWGVEILDHSDGCMDLTRLNSIGCVLFNHNRDKVIAKIINAWCENNRGYARIRFDTDDASDIIYQKVQGGTLKGVSTGYFVDNWEEVAPNKKSADGRFTGPCDIAKRWIPYEISIVSVPADPTVGIGRGMDEKPEEKTGRTLDFFRRQLQVNKNKYREAIK
ncbi:MAG: caudovirus prohead protease [Lachnospiraceae bacterium]|nr:caudovirus prohead protease [Lachnospiraceae bacterium]